MDRGEALLFMREISCECGNDMLPCWVSLDQFESGYTITLRCELSETTRDILRTLASRHGLRLMEKAGIVVISP